MPITTIASIVEDTVAAMLDFGWKAQEVLNVGRTTKHAMDAVKKWLRNSPFPQLTEEQIVLFLLSCQNDIAATEITIRAYYDVKHAHPGIFDHRHIGREDLQETQNVVCYGIMPRRTPEGYAVMYARLRETSYWKYNLEESVKLLFMGLDLIVMGDTPPTGLVFIFDMKGVGLMHLTRIRLKALKAFFEYLQDGLPLRLRHIHILNVVYFFDKLLSIIKPFMKKELLDMLILHPSGMDMEEFFRNHISRDCVPCDYGGNLPSTEELHRATVETMMHKKQFYDEEESQRKQYKP